MAHKCGKCDATWFGFKFSHCRECHRTFTTPRNFDAHRQGSLDSRYCDASSLAELRPGIWGKPGDSERFTDGDR